MKCAFALTLLALARQRNERGGDDAGGRSTLWHREFLSEMQGKERRRRRWRGAGARGPTRGRLPDESPASQAGGRASVKVGVHLTAAKSQGSLMCIIFKNVRAPMELCVAALVCMNVQWAKKRPANDQGGSMAGRDEVEETQKKYTFCND